MNLQAEIINQMEARLQTQEKLIKLLKDENQRLKSILSIPDKKQNKGGKIIKLYKNS